MGRYVSAYVAVRHTSTHKPGSLGCCEAGSVLSGRRRSPWSDCYPFDELSAASYAAMASYDAASAVQTVQDDDGKHADVISRCLRVRISDYENDDVDDCGWTAESGHSSPWTFPPRTFPLTINASM